jgi:hypothetical protein
MSDWKNSVRVATTSNITLSGFQTIDDVQLSTPNERVLVKDQMTPSQNGIYRVAVGAWPRASDADAPTGEVNPEMALRVSEGTVNAHTEWALITPKPITLGATPLTFKRVVGPETVSGADAVADIIALRALTAVDREDRQQRAVASITEQFMFLEGTGANVVDDGKFVIKPNDIALGSDGRWYRVPFQISKNLLDTPVNLTDADATLTLAAGRRYRLPNATLTQHRTVTLSNAGVVAGDTITIFSEQKDGPDITFASGPKTITRTNGSWIVDGFTSGMSITTTTLANGAVDQFVIENVTT